MKRLTSLRPDGIRALAQLVGLAGLLGAAAAGAADLDLKFEPGVALPVSRPQVDRFGVGGAATVKGLLSFEGGWVSVAGGLTFLGLPAQSGYVSDSMGTAWAPSLGLRIRSPRETEVMRLERPHQPEKLYGARPWIDGDLLYVRTGGLDRAGFATALGVAFPIGEQRAFWLGPFVRYLQILQPNRAGFDNKDSKTIILGLSLETGWRLTQQSAVAPVPASEPVAALECPPAPAAAPAAVCPPETVCPVCPVVALDKVIIKPDKLELKEKIQFLKDQAVIEEVSHPSLDEVAKVLQNNPGFKVMVEGHASSEGGEEHNQTLSEQRAQAVLDYLANKGVARERLKSKGFSSSRPLESNVTQSGREANRRVEFLVSFIILKEGSAR